jgi:hypothetical protein
MNRSGSGYMHCRYGDGDLAVCFIGKKIMRPAIYVRLVLQNLPSTELSTFQVSKKCRTCCYTTEMWALAGLHVAPPTGGYEWETDPLTLARGMSATEW